MYIIVGLGNPGKEYENTRHNCGFMVIDRLADELNIKINKQKHKALIGEGKVDDKRVLLAKPQTYMNLSGESILEIMKFYKEDMENLIVIFDDIDIPLGKIRIKETGSAGTHNGAKSVVSLLKTEEFKRIKIGVGSPNEIGLVDFVLGKFSKEEVSTIEKSIQNASDALKMIIQEERLTGAMNKYN